MTDYSDETLTIAFKTNKLYELANKLFKDCSNEDALDVLSQVIGSFAFLNEIKLDAVFGAVKEAYENHAELHTENKKSFS